MDENITRRIGQNCEYEIYKNNKLGYGSYSTVYLGRYVGDILNINRDDGLIAIKEINISDMKSETKILINSEITIMNWLITHNHNNIIKCYDVFEMENKVYIIMEYCDNNDLSTLIHASMSEFQIKQYFKQLVDAIKFLNNHNIIHRDIKPKNILLSGSTIKLCDFGFANKKEKIEKTPICGSPLYMAPEIMLKKLYTEAVDVWALGLILFEMIFGFHPFNKCKDMRELKETILISIKLPIKKEISQDCFDLLLMMLEIDPVKRIAISEIIKSPWISTLHINPILQNKDAKYLNDKIDNLIFDMDD